MTLMNLWGRRGTSRAPRRRRQFQPSARPYLEGLEQRMVLSHAGGAAAQVASAAQGLQDLVKITSLTASNVAITGANQITADLNIAGTLAGHQFNLSNVPVTAILTSVGQATYTIPGANGDPSTTDTCPILHLQLQIPDLNVLGLHVSLDDCSTPPGPVTVDVTAIPTGATGANGDAGGALGDLLCSLSSDLSGILSSSGGLLNLANLAGPAGYDYNSAADALTTALTDVLNGVNDGVNDTPGLLSGLLGGSSSGAGTSASALAGQTADLVNLHLSPVNLDVLGLDVSTSPICLDVYAQQGGGLLGNLLYGIDHLLSSPGSHGNAIQAKLNKVVSTLDGLL